MMKFKNALALSALLAAHTVDGQTHHIKKTNAEFQVLLAGQGGISAHEWDLSWMEPLGRLS